MTTLKKSYLRIMDAWQWFDLVKEARARHARELFARCKDQEFLISRVDSDGLFPHQEQAKLVQHVKHAQVPVMWTTIHSEKGHDAFLLEPRSFKPHLQQLLER